MKTIYQIFWMEDIRNIGNFDDSHTVLGTCFGSYYTEAEALKKIRILVNENPNYFFTIQIVYAKEIGI